MTRIISTILCGVVPLCWKPRNIEKVRMSLAYTSFAACCVLFSVAGVATASDRWMLGGSIRSLNLYSDKSPAQYYPSFKLTNNIFRLEAFGSLFSDWKMEAAGNLQLLGTSPKNQGYFSENDINRAFDLEHAWSMNGGWEGLVELDRLNLRWSGEKMSIIAGRQAVGFGRIAIFSPLDVIDPFPPDVLDSEYRNGIDALRISTYYSRSGQIEIISVFSRHEDDNSFFLTWEENLNSIDFLAIGGLLRERHMLGGGISGNIGLMGVKGEFVYYEGNNVGEVGGDLYDDYLVGGIELWNRFDNGITLITEYLYNGAGADSQENYVSALLSAPYTEGFSPLLGKDYLLLSAHYELHPLVELSSLFIWNLRDDSWMLRPSLDISLADNTSLTFFMTCPYGESADREDEVSPRSEFGSQAVSGGFFLKHYYSL